MGALLVIAAAFTATQARAQVANESIDAALIHQVREMALVACSKRVCQATARAARCASM